MQGDTCTFRQQIFYEETKIAAKTVKTVSLVEILDTNFIHKQYHCKLPQTYQLPHTSAKYDKTHIWQKEIVYNCHNKRDIC